MFIGDRNSKSSMVSENKRIAKNTIYLYLRSFLMMAINLYASRIILQALGVDDYGLYGAIGSIVAMFTIINGSLSAGTSRFLTFELGKGDLAKLKKTFNASLAMHTALAAFLFLLMETIGLWFVNCKMSIPIGREFAANVVYQLSVIACMFSLTQVPYGATIISHEKMDVYAYVGLVEAFFKLSLVFALLYLPFGDNLIAYAVILAVWGVGLQIFYRYYCYRRFEETHLSFCRDKNIYKEMFSYSVWDTVGAFCATGNSQGINILINVFFGVTVNAARQVACQVEGAVNQLATGFTASITPQIVKNYAQGDKKRFFQLINEAGRYSYFLMFLLAFPIILEANYILKLWLVEVPEYTVLFTRLVLAIASYRVIVRSTINGVHATGDVKTLNLTSGVYGACSFLPFVYILFKCGFPVWSYFILYAFNGVVCNFFEARSLYKNEKFDILRYITYVYLHPISVSLVAGIFPLVVVWNMDESFMRLVLTVLVNCVSMSFCVYTIGINRETRHKVNAFILTKIKKNDLSIN